MIRSRIFWLITALGCAVILPVLYLGLQVYWPGPVSVSVTGETLVANLPPASTRVAILRSRETAEFLHSGNVYTAHAQYWHDLLARRGWKPDFISDDQLEKLSAYRVLVLPAVACLSRKQAEAILAFIRQGNGVVATWATGTRNERGSWLGWGFAQQLTGADGFEVSSLPAPWYLAFGTTSPVTAGPAAGSRVQIVSADRVAATALRVDAYWSDFRFSPADSKLPPSYLGAILHKQVSGQGRVVWLGFHENSAAAGDKDVVDSLLLNSVAWTARNPQVTIDPWPAPYSSAVLLALQLEDSPANANYVADMLLQNRTEGSFYALSSGPRQDRELLQTLSHAGEVGSHGREAVPLDQLGRLQSAYQLLQSRRDLASASGHSVSGFAPLFGALPSQALPLLGLTGYRYFLSGGEDNSALPQVLSVSQRWGPLHREHRLVRLMRWGDPDLNLSPLGLSGLDQDWIVERISSDADAILTAGGLYVLLYHTQGLSAPEYVPALTQLITRWKAEPVWIATGSDIASWWLRRSAVAVSLALASPGTLRLNLDYRGPDPIQGLALTVSASSDPGGLKIVPITPGAPVPNLRISPEDDRVHLVFNRLPGGSYAYELRK